MDRYQKEAEGRLEGVFAHFNQRLASVVKRLEGDAKADYLRAALSCEGTDFNVSYMVPWFNSPNEVAINLSLDLSSGIDFSKFSPESVKKIPRPRDIARQMITYKRFKNSGKLKVERRHVLLFEAGFQARFADVTGKHEVVYLDSLVTIGKLDRTFISFYEQDLTRLAFAKDYPVKRAIDLAFRMYNRSPRQVEGIAVPHLLVDSEK